MSPEYEAALLNILKRDRSAERYLDSRFKRGEITKKTIAESRSKRDAAMVRFVNVLIKDMVRGDAVSKFK